MLDLRLFPTDAPVRPDGRYVLYWMVATRRTSFNFALDFAVLRARALGRPLLVFEPLRVAYPWASRRLHAFVLDGMRDNQAACAAAGVAYFPYVEPTPGAGSGLLLALAAEACEVVTDEQPGFFQPHMIQKVAPRLPVRLTRVDSVGLLPLRAGERAFPTAASFRRHLQRVLPPFLEAFPTAKPLSDLSDLGAPASVPASITTRWPAADLTDRSLLDRLPIDQSVRETLRGGEVCARANLADFLENRLHRYGEDRSHPDRDAASGLSPWLHFGHLSVHEIVGQLFEGSASERAVAQQNERAKESASAAERRGNPSDSLTFSAAEASRAVAQQNERAKESASAAERRGNPSDSLTFSAAEASRAVAQQSERAKEPASAAERRGNPSDSLTFSAAEASRAVAQQSERAKESASAAERRGNSSDSLTFSAAEASRAVAQQSERAKESASVAERRGNPSDSLTFSAAEAWHPGKLGPVTGSRAGWWGLDASTESFLDELVTWRELGQGFCFFRPDDAERYDSLPDWALATLSKHAPDRRPVLYTLQELECAGTHDAVWNAAQTELVRTGRMQNYLRMLWAKKVLEWSQSPAEALKILFHLNNKYAIDGRDPNSSSGIMWTFGRFDRPWGPERPIFGTIRYMSSDNTVRKLELKQYLARFGGQPTLL